MIVAIDVAYQESLACSAGVVFSRWDQDVAECIVTGITRKVNEYQPGQFFKRELPCILSLIDKLKNENGIAVDTVVVDGYVTLGAEARPGLGMHLWESLNREVVVVGVAKTYFQGTSDDAWVFRGVSKKPLYVTSAGIELDKAKERIQEMHGAFRIPELLKSADYACRQGLLKAVREV